MDASFVSDVFGIGFGHVVLITVMTGVGFFCSSVFGIGGTMILLPGLIVAFPAGEAVAIAAPAMLVHNSFKLLAFRRSIDRVAAVTVMLTAVPAAAVASFFTSLVDETLLKGGIGLAVVAALALEALQAIRIEHGRRGLAAWGVLIGATDGLSSAPGAPAALGLKGFGLAGPAFVGTIATMSIALQLAKLPSFIATGLLSEKHIPTVVLVGTVSTACVPLGRWVVERMSPDRFRKWLNLMLWGVAIWMLGGAVRDALL